MVVAIERMKSGQEDGIIVFGGQLTRQKVCRTIIGADFGISVRNIVNVGFLG